METNSNKYTRISLCGDSEAMVDFFNQILKNRGEESLISFDNTEEQNEAVLKHLFQTPFKFNDMIDWDTLSFLFPNQTVDWKSNIPNYNTKFKVQRYRQTGDGKCFLAITVDGENYYDWSPIVNQDVRIVWLIDNFEVSDNKKHVFKDCQISYPTNRNFIEYDASNINDLIYLYPVHYGIIRIKELKSEIIQLKEDIDNAEIDASCLSTSDPMQSYLLQKAESLRSIAYAKIDEVENIQDLWKELKGDGVLVPPKCNDTEWIEQFQDIDRMAPLWAIFENERKD